MSSYAVDGVLKEAVVHRRGLGQCVMTLTFAMPLGGERSVGKVSVHNDLREALVPGRRGRFYFAHVLDMRALHGLRLSGGVELERFPRMVEIGLALLALLNLGMAGLWHLAQGETRLLPILIGLTTGVMAAVMLSGRHDCARAFREDSGFAGGAAQPLSAPATSL